MKIRNLSIFKSKDTFIHLYERLFLLEKILIQIDKLRIIDINTINILEKKSISHIEILQNQYILFYVLYRSMFQRAEWEEGINGEICPSSYNLPDKEKNFMKIHNEIIDCVNSNFAHQDYKTFSRHIYNDPVIQNHKKYQVTLSNLKNHPKGMQMYVKIMIISVREVYKGLFNEDLLLFMRDFKTLY